MKDNGVRVADAWNVNIFVELDCNRQMLVRVLTFAFECDAMKCADEMREAHPLCSVEVKAA